MRLLSRYLVLAGVLTHVVLLGVVVLALSSGVDNLRTAWLDGPAAVARLVIGQLDGWKGEYERRSLAELGLGITKDEYAFVATNTTLDGGLGTGRIIAVGPSRQYKKPSDVTELAKPGDIVEIDPGDYYSDTARWHTDNLTLRGKGGTVHLHGEGTSLIDGKAIWLIQASNVRVEHIEFSGARAPDANGAGIRAEGSKLHVVSCFFHDNETGIMSNPVNNGIIVIEYSEFARNGHTNGQAHQVYIGGIKEFVLRYNYFHDTIVGSAVKSRAAVSRIEFNMIVDGLNGSSNYSVDLSDGGKGYLIGNVIEQGPRTNNSTVLTYAPEGARYDNGELFIVHNTLVSDYAGGAFLNNHSNAVAHFYNNLLIGAAIPFIGRAVAVGNVAMVENVWWQRDKIDWFGSENGSANNKIAYEVSVRDRLHFDYHLLPGAPAVDAGTALDKDDRLGLLPEMEYAGSRTAVARRYQGRPDAGAFELQ